MGLLGVTFIASWVVLSTLLLKYFNILSYGLSFFFLGSMGFFLFVNNYIFGMVFIRKKCHGCDFKELIIEHELVHLNSNATEKEVWETLKKVYSSDYINIHDENRICDYCPIPAHLKEK
jgi:hypothetical protein